MKILMYATFAAALASSLCVSANAQTTMDRQTVSAAAIQAGLDDVFKQLQTMDARTDRQNTLMEQARNAHDDGTAALANGDTLRAQELADASADLLNAFNPNRLREPTAITQVTSASPVVGNAGDMRQVAREDIAKTELMLSGLAPYSIAGGTSVEALTALAKDSLADAKAEVDTDARRAYFDSRRARYAAHAAALIASASDKSLQPPSPLNEGLNQPARTS